MKVSVSNIAWSLEDDEIAAELLNSKNISFIEIAPTIYFPEILAASKEDVMNVRNFWEKRGIRISSLQSLLFNKPELQLFGDDEIQEKLRRHLLKIGQIGEWLGAQPLVFGSPKNRLKGDISARDAKACANNFFRKLFEEWDFSSTFLAIEANPHDYGADFLTNSIESKIFVEELSSQKMKWHLDFGCSEMEGPSAVNCLKVLNDNPAHVHLSERNLAPLKEESKVFYQQFIDQLSVQNYSGFITLEMRNAGINSLETSINMLTEMCAST
jgi:sugar phosphate isomerase/epimerase